MSLFPPPLLNDPCRGDDPCLFARRPAGRCRKPTSTDRLRSELESGRIQGQEPVPEKALRRGLRGRPRPAFTSGKAARGSDGWRAERSAFASGGCHSAGAASADFDPRSDSQFKSGPASATARACKPGDPPRADHSPNPVTPTGRDHEAIRNSGHLACPDSYQSRRTGVGQDAGPGNKAGNCQKALLTR